MLALGGANENAVALADVDEVELEERLAAEMGDVDYSFSAAGHAGNGTGGGDGAVDANVWIRCEPTLIINYLVSTLPR